MSKILTIEGLRKYTHELITRLGLTNDTGAYAYASYTGTDRATVVKYALDELYDKLEQVKADGLADLTVTQADGSDYVTVELTNGDGESLGKFTLSPADDHIALTVDGTDLGIGLSVSDAWADADDKDILTKIAVDAMLQEASTAVDIEWNSGYETGAEDVTFEEAAVSEDGTIRSFMYRQGASQWQNIIIDEATVKAFTDDKVANIFIAEAEQIRQAIADGLTINGLPANFDENYTGSFIVMQHGDANTGELTGAATVIAVSSLLKGVVNGNGINVQDGTISLNVNTTADDYVSLGFNYKGELAVTYAPVLGELPESSMPEANGVAVENRILHRLSKEEVPAYLKDENAEPAYVYWNGSDATVLESLTAEQQASGNYLLYVLLDKDAATDTKLMAATYRGGAIGAKTKEFIDGPIALVREKDSAAEFASCDYVLLEAAVLRRGMLGGEIQSDNKVFTTGQEFDGLVTATNIAAIGNQLNEIIDTLAEEIDGAHSDVTTSGEEITVSETADPTTGAVTYDIRYATVTDADIESIFG